MDSKGAAVVETAMGAAVELGVGASVVEGTSVKTSMLGMQAVGLLDLHSLPECLQQPNQLHSSLDQFLPSQTSRAFISIGATDHDGHASSSSLVRGMQILSKKMQQPMKAHICLLK